MPDPPSPSAFEAALRDALTDVLHKMFFIGALDGTPPSGAGREFDPLAELAARVHFHGEPSGDLLLVLNRQAARGIAADFLGENGSCLTGREVEEVFCELANMICGAVLSRVESAATFQLASPVIEQRADNPSRSETAKCVFPVGDAELTARIWMEEPVCRPLEKSAC
jgi:CheY-specific phosphatase CheX